MWVAPLVQLVVCVVLTLVTPPGWHPWVQLAGAALVAVAATVRLRGAGLADLLPARRARGPVDVVDLVTPDRALVGCVDPGRRDGRHVVTTALELSAGADTPAVLGPAGVAPAADDGAPTGGGVRRVPLTLLAAQLDDAGPPLEGVDLCVEGRRAADTDTGDAYAALVGPLPIVSTRRVTVLLRFDLDELARTTVGDLVDGPAPGGADPVSALVALATERVRRAVVHHGYPCRVLDSPELAELYVETAGIGAAGSPGDPRASDSADGETVAAVLRSADSWREVADRLWGTPAAAIAEVVRIRRAPGAPAGTVRVLTSFGVRGADDDPFAGLERTVLPLPSGDARPVPSEELRSPLPACAVERDVRSLDGLAPAAHGSGQVLGATRTGEAFVLAVSGPHLRTVVLAGDTDVVRQVVVRAAGSGRRLAVVSDSPARWAPLRGVLAAAGCHVTGPDALAPTAPVDAVVWDVAGGLSEARVDAFAGPDGADVTPPTVIRVVPAGGPGSDDEFTAAVSAGPDLVLDGRVRGWLSVERPGAEPVSLGVVSVPAERALLGDERADEPSDAQVAHA